MLKEQEPVHGLPPIALEAVPVTNAVCHGHAHVRAFNATAHPLAAMYFDLNFLVPPPSRTTGPTHAQSNKGKGKQVQHSQPTIFSQSQLEAIEARIDLLVHCARSLAAALRNVLIGRPV